MSAKSVIGIPAKIAEQMDAFWANCTQHDRTALQTAFIVLDKRRDCQEAGNSQRGFNPERVLQIAASGQRSICNVQGAFLHFVEWKVTKCPTPTEMMAEILSYGEKTEEEQLADWQGDSMPA